MMTLINDLNKNFYWLMVIVIGILFFVELRDSRERKNDSLICKVLIWIYSFGSLCIFMINIFK